MLVRLYIWFFVLGDYEMKSLGKLLFFKPNYTYDSVKQETLYQTSIISIMPYLSFQLT